MILETITFLQSISIIITFLISLILSSIMFFHITYYWLGKLKFKRSNTPPKSIESFPLVTIIVPVKNEPLDVITRHLKSIVEQSYPKDKIEVIIVSDDEEEYFRRIMCYVRSFSRESGLMVRVFRRERAVGFKAGALNYALQRSRGKYVVVFDVDAVPEPDYLEKVVSFMETNNDVAGLAVRWIPLNTNSSPVSEVQAVSLSFLTSIFFDGRSRTNGPMIIPGCGCVFPRRVLLEMSGWNEKCLAEDVELSIRLLLNGRRIAYLSDARVWIENPETYEVFKKQQARWIYGTTQVLLKYFPKIIGSKMPLTWKLYLILYLLQYHVLLANFALAVLALMSILVRMDLLLSSIYFSPILLTLSMLQAFSYYNTARNLGFNPFKSIIIIGRCTAMAAVLAPIVLLQNIKILVKWREEWYITPKGSLARKIRGRSLNIMELLLAMTGILIGTILLKLGFPASASCLFTMSLPYLYVSWKTSKGAW